MAILQWTNCQAADKRDKRQLNLPDSFQSIGKVNFKYFVIAYLRFNNKSLILLGEL